MFLKCLNKGDMNLTKKINVNFNIILKFLLKNTLDLDFKMDFQLPIFIHPSVLSPFRPKKVENKKMHFQKTYEKKVKF
jgi:hypothetical protein